MPERYVAIDNVCAWPNLTLTPDGSIAAIIWNQPCHGRWEGDVECWASVDGGRFWALRNAVTAPEPGTNRFNIAAGLAGNGDLVALVSGWNRIPPAPKPKFRSGGRIDPNTGQTLPAQHDILEGGDETAEEFYAEKKTLPVLACRSGDGGATWRNAPAGLPEEDWPPIPFGDILPGGDGALYATAYKGHESLFLRSDDDGRSWEIRSTMGSGCYNETAVLHLGDGKWIAALRTSRQRQKYLQLFRSDDEGMNWRYDQNLTLPQQIPAHFLRLQDNRILLVYGMRSPRDYGVAARISEDEGKTWSPALKLVDYPDADGGYPSSVQTADGKIVTAYYCASQPIHNRYHMGVVIWETSEFNCKGWPG